MNNYLRKMIDICLKNKIIYGFLKNYKHKKWNNIIPSLLEIAILNLYSSFNRYIFSEEDFSLIILNLKSKNNIPLEKEQYFKNKKINNKREKLNLDIPEFRRNFKLNSQDCLKLRNESYRSFSNKPKNINELNIYSNNTKDNKRIHFYNRSSVVTPIKKLINYNEMDLSIGDNNKSTNIYKLYNKRKSKNSFKFNYNNNKKIIDYNTVDRCKYTDKYENVFNSHKSLYINRNMNFSHSIDYKKDKDKNYINVNINDNSSNKKYDKNINEEGKIMKKNSEFLTKKIKEIRNKTNLINKIGKLKEINEKRKKQKNILTSFNKEQILKLDENKKNICLNTNNYYKENKNLKNICKVSNSSLLYNSPRTVEYKGICKLEKYINEHNHNNQNKLNININNFKQIKTMKKISFTKNIKKIILNRVKRKENSNINLIDEMNKSSLIINDKNISSSNLNNNSLKNNEQTSQIFLNNKRKKIINYNSYNNYKNSKHSISLNDPQLFKKSPRTKIYNFVQKISNTNANGSNDNNN
jgi:hypothetical protein